MMTAPCYVYRAADSSRARHLDAIAEPAVDEATGELVLVAIEGVVERRNILHEMCTDAELAVERAPAHTNGFHAGVTMAAADEALVRGGFVVHRVDDAADDLGALERHLDLTSLDVVLRSIAAGDEELPVHAASAEEILQRAIVGDAPGDFAAAAATRAARHHPELVDALVLLATRAAAAADRDRGAAARALVAALPAATDPRVRRAVRGPQ
jgi:hypothetical protein